MYRKLAVAFVPLLALALLCAPGHPSTPIGSTGPSPSVPAERAAFVSCPPPPSGALSGMVEASAKPTPADIGSSLNFYGIFTGFSGPVTLNWSFGDGSCSTAQYPVHLYTTPGNYTVVFWVTSTCCGIHSASFHVLINPAIVSGVSFLPTNPDTSSVVNFTATPSQGTPPYVGFWNFGDGTTATGLTVLHTYHAAGTYTVRLWANDSGEGSAPQTLQVTVTSGPGGGSQPTGSTEILIGTSVAAIAVAAAGFAYFQWDKKRRPKLPTSNPPPNP